MREPPVNFTSPTPVQTNSADFVLLIKLSRSQTNGSLIGLDLSSIIPLRSDSEDNSTDCLTLFMDKFPYNPYNIMLNDISIF